MNGRRLGETKELIAIPFAVAVCVRVFAVCYAGAVFDDTYITLRVARNLATGWGMVYNPGEAVQASTSPLWVLLESLLWPLLKAQAVIAAQFIGAVCDSAAAACLALLTARAVARSTIPLAYSARAAGLIAGLLYATMPTTAAVAGMGLETGAYTLGIAGVFLLLSAGRHDLAALVSGITVMTRPDGVLAVGVVLLFVGWRQRSVPWKQALIAAAVYLPYAIFATGFYGSPVPQSLIAKSYLERSASYEWRQFLERFFLGTSAPVGMLVLFGLWQIVRHLRLGWPLLAWGALYVVGFSTLASWWPWYLPPAMLPYSFACAIGIASVAALAQHMPYWIRGFQSYIRFAAVTIVMAAFLARLFVNLSVARSDFAAGDRLLHGVADALTELSAPGETIMTEPLGIIGFHVSRRFYDYPGLAAPQVTDAVARLHRRIPGKPINPAVMKHLLSEVQPRWLVLREDEFSANEAGGALAGYTLVRVVPLPSGLARSKGPIQRMFLLRRTAEARPQPHSAKPAQACWTGRTEKCGRT